MKSHLCDLIHPCFPGDISFLRSLRFADSPAQYRRCVVQPFDLNWQLPVLDRWRRGSRTALVTSVVNHLIEGRCVESLVHPRVNNRVVLKDRKAVDSKWDVRILVQVGLQRAMDCF